MLSKYLTPIKPLIRKFIKPSYNQKLENEIKFYEKVFDGKLFQQSNMAWNEVNIHCSLKIQKITKYPGLAQYIAGHTKNKKNIKLLGLGSGACGVELDCILPEIAKNGTKLDLTCLDINKKILDQANIEAKKRGAVFHADVQDINELVLPTNHYDVILAHASLHHFINLKRISKQINKSLKPNGFFITVDIPTKNGYLMWPETYKVVQNIWNILPDKYKIDHTKYNYPHLATNYENIDYSTNSFECINSEAILPSLRKYLKEKVYIPELSISRRFFDSKFGPNYDLNQPLDRAIFDFIVNLDIYYLDNKILKPETFFGVYTKK